MSTKTLATLSAVFGLIALLALLTNSGGMAQGAAPSGGTVPYSGQLSDELGQPVADGAYAFGFALYDAAQGGKLLWSETQSGVAVKGGGFTAQLGSVTALPDTARANSAWLAVSVRGPEEAGFTELNPRQLLDTAVASAPASPAAAAACAHDHFGESWIGDSTGTLNDSGLYIKNTKLDGYGLYIESPTGAGLYSSGGDYAGVFGISTDAAGVYGGSTNGVGVQALTSSSSKPAVLATNYAITGTAISIHGAIRVVPAGIDSDTPVFIHQVNTAAGGNICPLYSGMVTVIDNPFTNNDPNAILIVTLNGGVLGHGIGPTNPYIFVEYDRDNDCGFGTRWVIFNNLSAIPNGTLYNVMVIKP